MSKERAGAFEDAAQLCRDHLKYQNFPLWVHADYYQRGAIATCKNIEKKLLERAAEEMPSQAKLTGAPGTKE